MATSEGADGKGRGKKHGDSVHALSEKAFPLWTNF
jgi:hypothetical protein